MKRNRITAIFGTLLIASTFALLPLAESVVEAAVCNSPTITRFGRTNCHGYYSNTNFERPNGTWGWNVVNCEDSSIGCPNGTQKNNAIPFNAPTCTASQLPCGVKNAADFEKWMTWYLSAGYNYNHSGAAFLVDTMLNKQGSSFGNVTNGINYAIAHFQEWKDLIEYYQAQGWIQWNVATTIPVGTVNSMHSCNTSYTPMYDAAGNPKCNQDTVSQSFYDGRDFEFFNDPDAEPSHLIIFNNPNGSKFEIRRECANLIGQMAPLVPPPPTPTVHPTCGSMIVNPGRPDPKIAFNIQQAIVSYKNTTEANQVIASADQLKLSVTGPGISYTNNNIAINQDGSDIYAVSPNLGPSNNTGTYTVNWGVTGSDLPSADINCSATFVIADMPYFVVNGGDVSAGGGMSVN
ncbi:MAG TPA: hypothetical protein VLG47_06370 [Candidatus Saccharimonadales bacterium]|nr:hypothetical protein [Candidatus Saccharimonadales bacterium]